MATLQSRAAPRIGALLFLVGVVAVGPLLSDELNRDFTAYVLTEKTMPLFMIVGVVSIFILLPFVAHFARRLLVGDYVIGRGADFTMLAVLCFMFLNVAALVALGASRLLGLALFETGCSEPTIRNALVVFYDSFFKGMLGDFMESFHLALTAVCRPSGHFLMSCLVFATRTLGEVVLIGLVWTLVAERLWAVWRGKPSANAPPTE